MVIVYRVWKKRDDVGRSVRGRIGKEFTGERGRRIEKGEHGVSRQEHERSMGSTKNTVIFICIALPALQSYGRGGMALACQWYELRASERGGRAAWNWR